MGRKLKVLFPKKGTAQDLFAVKPKYNPSTSVWKFPVVGHAPPKATNYQLVLTDLNRAAAVPLKWRLLARPTRQRPTFVLAAWFVDDKGKPAPPPDTMHECKLEVRATVPGPGGKDQVLSKPIPHIRFEWVPPINGKPAVGPLKVNFPTANDPQCNDGIVAYGYLANEDQFPVTSARLEDDVQQITVPHDVVCTDLDLFWFATFPTTPDGLYLLTVEYNGGTIMQPDIDVDAANC